MKGAMDRKRNIVEENSKIQVIYGKWEKEVNTLIGEWDEMLIQKGRKGRGECHTNGSLRKAQGIIIIYLPKVTYNKCKFECIYRIYIFHEVMSFGLKMIHTSAICYLTNPQ